MGKSTPTVEERDAVGMSKFDLDYLTPDKTVWHTLDRVRVPRSNPNCVRLELRSSGRINGPYTEAVMKINREREKEGVPGTVSGLEASDAQQLQLFARHCVVGWADILDEKGSPLPFNAKDVEELLKTVSIGKKRPDLIAPALFRAADQSNFDTDPEGSAETLGKS